MFGSAKAKLCKVLRDIAKVKRGRSMRNKARAKYSQAETSEGIAWKSAAAAEQGET